MVKITFLLSALVLFQCINVYAYEFSSQTDKIVKAMLKKDYGDALDKSRALEIDSIDDIKAEALYFQGMTLVSLGEYYEARTIFEKALSLALGDLSIEVYMGIADSYFRQYSFKNALSVYTQVLDNYPNSNYEAMLLYKIGKSYQKNSEWLKSNDYFKILKEKYPQSFQLKLLEKSSSGGDYFTIAVGAFLSKKNAQDLLDNLKNKGYDAYLVEGSDKAQKIFKVRVGKFVSRIAAEFEEEKLRLQEHLPTKVLP